VVSRARQSILLIRAYDHNGPSAPHSADAQIAYRHILVPLDGSQRAEHVLPAATALAHEHDAELLLAHVVVQPEMIQRMPLTSADRALVEQMVERNRAQAQKYFDSITLRLSPRPRTHVLIGRDAATTLQQFIQDNDVDLLILSAHGYSGETEQRFGDVAQSLITCSATSLLVLQDLPAYEIELTEAERAVESANNRAGSRLDPKSNHQEIIR
jgi:nucleotide-binding universal stress UspA family protein